MIRWVKVMLFRAAPKWYLGSILQGMRTQNTPKHIRAPLFAMNTTQTPLRHPSDTPQTPPSHLQWIKNISRRQYAQTHIARHTQTAPVSVQGCLAVSVGICCRLMASWVPWRCLGGVWRMSGGCLGVSGWKSWKSEVLGFVGVYLGSQSLQYGAKTLIWSSPERHDFCSSDHIETSK